MRKAHVRTLIASVLATVAVLPGEALAQANPSSGAAAASFRRATWSRPTQRAWNAGAEVAQRTAYNNAIQAGKTPQQAMAISNAMAAAAPFALASMEEDRATRAMILQVGSFALAGLGIAASATGVGAAAGVPLMLAAASLAAGAGAQVCVSTSCGIAIKADPNDPDNPKLVGTDVNAVGESTPVTATYNGAVYSGTMYQGQYGYEQNVAAYEKVGYFTTFPCQAAYAYAPYNTFHQCVFIPLSQTGNSYAAWGLPNKEMFQYFGTGIIIPPVRLAQSGEGATHVWQGYVSTDKWPRPGFFVSNRTWTSPEAVPHTTYAPVPASAVAGAVTGAVTTKAAAEPMSKDAIAALANEIAKRIAANGLPEAYSPTAPATSADAEAWQQRNPERVPSVADVYSPITANGSLPKPTTEARPAVDPLEVNVVNQPSAGTSTGTGTGSTAAEVQKTKEEADEELDSDPGLVGDVLKPVKDFVAGPLKPWLAPNLTIPGGQCPWSEFDLGDAWDGKGGVRTEVTSTKSVFCGTVDDYTPTIQAILAIIYTFMVPMIIFRRS